MSDETNAILLEMQKTLGELVATTSSHKNQTTDLFAITRQMEARAARYETKLDMHIESSEKRHDDIEEELAEVQKDVTECAAGVSEYRSDKKWGFRMLGVVSFVLAAIWNGLIKLGEFFFS